MSKSFPLQTLLDLSHLRLDEATRRLGELMSGQQEAQQRVDLLVEYRAEYQSRFVVASQNGIAPSEWQNFRGFLAKLDHAVEQAQVMLEQSRRSTAYGQKTWLEKRGNVKAYDTLADRHRHTLMRRELKQEQAAGDEHSARKYSHGETDPDGNR